MSSSKSYVQTGLAMEQKTRSHPRNVCCLRYLNDEDDNQFLAHSIKRQNRSEKLKHTVCSIMHLKLPSSSPAAVLVAPKQRGFNWTIETWHAPRAYHPKDLRRKSPWIVCLRFLATDMENELEDGAMKNWRDSPVLRVGVVKDNEASYCSLYRQFRRRVVFSEISSSGKYLIGRWLVVAYVWCDSRDQLNTFDWTSHISVDTMYMYKAFERTNTDSSEPAWRLFHCMDRFSKGFKPGAALPQKYDGDRTQRTCCIVDQAVGLLVSKQTRVHTSERIHEPKIHLQHDVISSMTELREEQKRLQMARIAMASTLL
ncbi:hypothetical protein FHETE_5544 [Fusarium heterosporum]|uniref:Uncharacterized protein n=1 Tax=Fusarium heterosporum TaxID=42747 RepID=A0A8H5TE05_FUSHE|nr:hypothetical protein FHETE_5544 [Fusarium heterosporum]